MQRPSLTARVVQRVAARSSRSRAAVVAAAIWSAALGGCAAVPSAVRTDVTTFHEWQNAEPLTFAFRRTAEQQQSLEHLDYEAQVGVRLQSLGFRPEPAGSARYLVGVSHSTTTHVQRRVYPGFGGHWAFPRHPYGSPPMFADPWFWGPSMFADPWFWGPPMPMYSDVPVSVHALRVDLFDTRVGGAAQGKVFESTARTAGTYGGLPAVMPALVAAVFADFPGPSGRTREVVVERSPPP
jgi:hypothetical protein